MSKRNKRRGKASSRKNADKFRRKQSLVTIEERLDAETLRKLRGIKANE